MEGTGDGDESPRTVLCQDSQLQSQPLFTDYSMLPALEGCPARSAKRRRAGEELFQHKGHLNSAERAANGDSFPRTLAKKEVGELEDTANDLFLCTDGGPSPRMPFLLGIDPKRQRVGYQDKVRLNSAEQEANADSSPRTLAKQEVCGLEDTAPDLFASPAINSRRQPLNLDFHELPDEVLVKILSSDQRTRTVVSIASKNLRAIVQRNSAPCCGRFSDTLECQIYSMASSSNLSTICTLGRDLVLQIVSKLVTSDMARLGRTCSCFRCLLICSDSRHFIRQYSTKCQFVGALVSNNALSKYPVLLSSLMPRHQQPVVEIWAAFWRKFAKDNKFPKVQLIDCRDGRIVLLEGKQNVCTKIIVCNPFSVNRATTVVLDLPSDLIQEPSCYVCSTFVPDDDGYNFSLIMLMAREAACRESSIMIGKYISKIHSWSFKRQMWEWEVPSRSTIRLPSVLSDKKVYYLQASLQVLTVDCELNIDRMPIPDMSRMSYQNHILAQSASGMLCLVAVTGRKVCVFEYISSSSTWNLSKEFEGPGDSTDCRLIGSGKEKILIHAADRLCCMDLLDGHCFDVSIGSKFVRHAFCYELQHPPVAEFHRRLQ